jgi:citrate lyase beta subunit
MTVPGLALLSCPGDRPERFAKAAAVEDGTILDLEDGVALAPEVAVRAPARPRACGGQGPFTGPRDLVESLGD